MAAAVAAIPVKTVGLSPTAIGVWTLVAGLLLGMIKVWPVLRKLGIEADASLRTDLLKRISTLETGQAEMIRGHADEVAGLKHELAEQRRKCDEEQASLRKQMDGLMSIIRQLSMSSGHVIDLSPLATEAGERTRQIQQEKGE
ncbi:hypothetical protein KFK14_11240 [Sphingobium phenoxybenzoativorans]|uniref:Uncharacterized protein n=1 Tax=Sphingobium phenoxybenzoativorans TaxID=1592790 RepID=A0A975Q3X0_9SPHN|nr:hypothetical protein [Sphingobium phenoxybenzoativorans]QUT07903.1 hypothetical protein KFK14_11240 [Sphingobium phenoxybenzoativorans]